MKIEIFSDYACPYCYIGKRHLEAALKDLGLEDAQLIHRVYILDPGKISHPERTYLEGLNLKTAEEKQHAANTFASITRLAADIGLAYHMDTMKDIATEMAHRLTLWVQETAPDQTQAVIDRIFHAHFIDNKDISSKEVLLDLISSLPLDPAEATAVLDDPSRYVDQIFEDDDRAQQLDLDYIPFFVINDSDHISGIVNTEKLKAILSQNS
ncbi:DsbA family protein [Peptococcus simiae]|uniref:DsbA family oxidoreductase n=1 Tax=Peptococcus simiae TaxID=1643805 RepID=UPI00397F7615